LVRQSPPISRPSAGQDVSCHLKRGSDSVSHDPWAKWAADQLPEGVETERGLEEVPEEEIIRGYEHTKGHHVHIKPEELDELKLEAKHTIDMARFVDRDETDSRYFEKPYYLLPDGDSADEGYVVLRDALAESKKLAIGQLIMHGREHLVGITAHNKGLMLVILGLVLS
jgi:Ku protein